MPAVPNSMQNAKPKRLALVITELEPGGAERCLVEIAIGLDRSKFSPVVVSLAPPPVAIEKQILIQRLRNAGITTHFLNATRAWDFFAAVRRLADLFRGEQIEIVQTFLFHGNVLGARAAKAANVPHLLAGVRVAEPRRWRIAIERWATSAAARFVCVSQSVAAFCRHRGFASEKLVVIPNGVDVTRWQASHKPEANPLGLVEGRRGIVFVGRLDKQKGLDRFFCELPAVFDALPEYDFVLVGDGPQRAALQRVAKRLGLASRVHFVGWKPDAAPSIAAADILVLPSRWEGMPNVVLEAMAAGKPVVATQAEGTVELLGIAALEQTAAVGDWDSFRRRLIEIGRNSQLAAELGGKNQARAGQFSISAMVLRYERLFESIIGS
jgi:glycosyltransferase involved in cell wall biosynthesis